MALILIKIELGHLAPGGPVELTSDRATLAYGA